eukprot:6422355-Amphidinium_carterae.2
MSLPPPCSLRLDWCLVSKSLPPTCGTEEVTDYKPDHRAFRLPIAIEKVSQGFRGQPDYEEPTVTDGIELANCYLEAKARPSRRCR